MECVVVMENNENYIREYKNDGVFKKFQLFIRKFLHDPVSQIQLFKFCSVGILNTIIGYGAFFLLVNYLYYLLALLIAHIIGVIHSFLWNKYWIFRIKKFNFKEFAKFNVIYILVFVVNAAALFISVDLIHADPKLAQLLLLPVITGISFFGQKLWTFKGKVIE